MLVVTLSKARLGHSPGPLASPRDVQGNRSVRVVDSQQVNVTVVGHEEGGSVSPTCTAANGSKSAPCFGYFKCKDKRYLTCPKYITEHKFYSNITQKYNNITNYSIEHYMSYTKCDLFTFLQLVRFR